MGSISYLCEFFDFSKNKDDHHRNSMRDNFIKTNINNPQRTYYWLAEKNAHFIHLGEVRNNPNFR